MTERRERPFLIADQGDGWWQGTRRVLEARVIGELPPRPKSAYDYAIVPFETVPTPRDDRFSGELIVLEGCWEVFAGERPWEASVQARVPSKRLASINGPEGLEGDARINVLAPGYLGGIPGYRANAEVSTDTLAGHWRVVDGPWTIRGDTFLVNDLSGFEKRVTGLDAELAIGRLAEPIIWYPPRIFGLRGKPMERTADRILFGAISLDGGQTRAWACPVNVFARDTGIGILHVFEAGIVEKA